MPESSRYFEEMFALNRLLGQAEDAKDMAQVVVEGLSERLYVMEPPGLTPDERDEYWQGFHEEADARCRTEADDA